MRIGLGCDNLATLRFHVIWQSVLCLMLSLSTSSQIAVERTLLLPDIGKLVPDRVAQNTFRKLASFQQRVLSTSLRTQKCGRP